MPVESVTIGDQIYHVGDSVELSDNITLRILPGGVISWTLDLVQIVDYSGLVSSPNTPEHMAHLAASCTDEVFRRWLELWSMPPETTRSQMCSRVLEYGPGEVASPEDASELARLLKPAPDEYARLAVAGEDEPIEDLEWLKGLAHE